MRVRSKGNEGYTLIELAVSILVLGMFMVAAIPLYDLYVQKTMKDETVVAQRRIDIAIETFKNLRGRYPCPARYDAAPGSPAYGQETACYGLTAAPGTCLNGLCVEQSERIIKKNDGSDYAPLVVRGSIPFVALGLPEPESYDAYGSRYSYAVTDILTNKAEYRIDRGGIEIVDGHPTNPKTVLEPAASAHYFVFSHGPDKVGGYTMAGTLHLPCNGLMFDNENCDTSPASANARYRLTEASDKAIRIGTNAATEEGGGDDGVTGSAVNEHFDDSVDYVGIGEQPLWEISETPSTTAPGAMELSRNANPHDIVRKRVVMGTDDMTGIEDLGDEVLLYVAGNMQADRKTRAEKYCEETGTKCIYPALFQNEDKDGNLRCPVGAEENNQAATHFDENTMKCSTGTQCPEGTYALGVDSRGILICDNLAKACEAETKSICGQNKVLPKSKDGASVILEAGASRKETYTCNNGKWEGPSNISGVCTCTQSTETTVNRSCGANYTGTIVEKVTKTCPSGETTTTTVTNSCACKPSKTTKTEQCAVGYEGEIVKETTVVCNNGQPSSSTKVIKNTCSCTIATQTGTINCPTGFDGKINRERKTSCANGVSGGYGPWENKSNSCKCKGPSDRDVSCGPEYNTGKIVMRTEYECDMSKLTAKVKEYEKQNTCGCVPQAAVKTTRPCDYGYSGTIKVTKGGVSCVNGKVVKEPDSEDRSACQPEMAQCTIKVTGGSLGNFKAKYPEGYACTYQKMDPSSSECAKITNCYKTLGTGVYETYSCSCQ